MNNNLDNKFVEASMRYGIHCLDSPEETVMMFYNETEAEQVQSLTELLGAEKFAQVQSGRRIGF